MPTPPMVAHFRSWYALPSPVNGLLSGLLPSSKRHSLRRALAVFSLIRFSSACQLCGLWLSLTFSALAGPSATSLPGWRRSGATVIKRYAAAAGSLIPANACTSHTCCGAGARFLCQVHLYAVRDIVNAGMYLHRTTPRGTKKKNWRLRARFTHLARVTCTHAARVRVLPHTFRCAASARIMNSTYRLRHFSFCASVSSSGWRDYDSWLVL